MSTDSTKNSIYLKMTIDVLMAITFVLLLNKTVLGGLPFHEVAGTAISVAFATHILLNWNWVFKVSTNLFSGKLPAKTRIGYGLNLSLLLLMGFVIVGGILISKILFPAIHVGNKRWLTVAHISFSFLILALVGIHVGLHWKWVAAQGSRLSLGLLSFGRYAHMVSIAGTILLTVYGGYEIYQTHYLEKLGLVKIVLDPRGPRERSAEDDCGGGSRERLEPSGVKATSETGERRRPNVEKFTNPNAGEVLLSYLGVMSFFVIVTYCCDNWLTRRSAGR